MSFVINNLLSVSRIRDVVLDMPETKIRTIQSMQEIRSEMTEGACCFVDLDETIIQVPTHLGSQSFRRKIIQILKNSEEFKKIAQFIHDKITYLVAQNISYIAVENSTPSLFQECKIPIFGLTSRGKDHWYDMPIGKNGGERLTIQHLVQAGYTMSTLDTPHESFSRGVFFCYPIENKGEFIRDLFKGGKPPFSKLIFVDDKLDHVNSVSQAFKELRIPSVCFHYTPNSLPFDLMTANIQLDRLLKNGKILSNEEAEALKNSEEYRGKDSEEFFLDLANRFKE